MWSLQNKFVEKFNSSSKIKIQQQKEAYAAKIKLKPVVFVRSTVCVEN